MATSQPVDRPSTSNASGNIVSATIVSSAPAAKAWASEPVRPDAGSSSAKPIAALTAETAITRRHIRNTRPRAQPAQAETTRRRHSLRQVAEQNPEQQLHAHLSLKNGEAQNERLGDPIEHGAEHDRQRLAGRLRAISVLAVAGTTSFEPPVADAESGGTDQGDDSDQGDIGCFHGLVDQLERHRTDQQAGTECHHNGNQLPARRRQVGNECTDQQRRRTQSTPQEGRDHVERLIVRSGLVSRPCLAPDDKRHRPRRSA